MAARSPARAAANSVVDAAGAALAGGAVSDGGLRPRRHATSITSVTPSTRSRMIRSMPAFSVCVDAGQPTHAPISSTRHHAGVLVDVVQDDVAAVGLQRRADHLDRPLDLGAQHSLLLARGGFGGDRRVDAPSQPVRPAEDSVVGRRSVGGVIAISLLAHQGGWDEMLLVGGADRVRRRPAVGGEEADEPRRTADRRPRAGCRTGARQRRARRPRRLSRPLGGQTRSMSAPTAARRPTRSS